MRFRAAVTAGEVAELVGGAVRGPSERALAGLAAITAAGPGDLAFAHGPGAAEAVRSSSAGAVLVSADLTEDVPAGTVAIVVRHPVVAAQQVLAKWVAREDGWTIHPTVRLGRGCRWDGRIRIEAGAEVGPEVQFGRDCVVRAGAVIEAGVRCGDGCEVGRHATVCAGSVLGHRVRIHAGARVGGVGFGFVPDGEDAVRVPHVAQCVLEDDVEVGANTTIDRGATRDTVIGAGTKIDNLVQIAHNVRVGRRCIIMAQVGIAGSTVVEDDVMLAGQAGLADHLTVGRGSRVAAQSGVIGDIAPGSTISGYPARDHRSVLRQVAAVQRLTPLVSSLERIVNRDE